MKIVGVNPTLLEPPNMYMSDPHRMADALKRSYHFDSIEYAELPRGMDNLE